MKARPYRLTRSKYRGKQGWLISGGPNPWGMSVFVEGEVAARRMISRLRTEPDYEIKLEDFSD